MGRRIYSSVLLIVFMSVSLSASMKLSKQQCFDNNSAKGCYDYAIDVIERTGQDNGHISDADLWKLALEVMMGSCDGRYDEACIFYTNSQWIEECQNVHSII